MKESEFCWWFKKNVEWMFFYFKLSDQDQRLKPFDSFGVMQWVPLAIEFKKVDGHIAYPFKELRWSSPKNPWGQVKWLAKHSANGWLSLVIVFSRKACRFEVFRFDDLHLDYKYDFNER